MIAYRVLGFASACALVLWAVLYRLARQASATADLDQRRRHRPTPTGVQL